MGVSIIWFFNTRALEIVPLFAVLVLEAVSILFVLVLLGSGVVDGQRARVWEYFEYPAISCRAHSAVLTDFGGVGDGTTLNTEAFRAAITHLSQFESEGGSQLFVPPGRWLTGSFNLTNHFTLYLHRDAVLLASQDINEWPVVDPLPSYGRGRDMAGGRYISFIFGTNLTDVVITGDNGTIDGQGALWWDKFHNGELQYTRPYLIEIMFSENIQIYRILHWLTLSIVERSSGLPVYSSNIIVQGITILAPVTSPNTDGINPDSCLNTRIEDCYIVSGDDCIAVKSGWDEYGIAFGMPTKQLVIRRLTCISPTSAVIALGSEMSGGIQDVRAENILAIDSESGVRIKTANINYRDMVAENVTMAAMLEGIPGDPFTGICISNVTIELAKKGYETHLELLRYFWDFEWGVHTCTTTRDLKLGSYIHAKIVKSGIDSDEFISNSLIDMYTKCDHIENAGNNSLIDGYAKSRKLGAAEEVLDRFSGRDVVSWTSAISGHVGNGMMKRALVLFFKMQEDGVQPNETEWCRNALVMNSLVEMYVVNGYFKEATQFFVTSVLTTKVCTRVQRPWQVFFRVVVILARSCLRKRFTVFRMMSFRDIITWNTLVTCLVKNERSSEVLKLLSEIHAYGAEDDIFSRFCHDAYIDSSFSDLASLRLGQQIFTKLKESGVYQPNAITFINVLSACGHTGLIEEAFEIFHCLKREYGIDLRMELFACTVDLLGRSGRLKETEAFIEKMSVRPDPDMWGALLGACALFNNVEIAESAANELSVLGTE
ncbi:pectin lyase-like superfamily protein [Actinidia rufa]|uniref:Pectin lyase-like superfamily protein n=1 Tax=Actinidia rufa TaxID=165716 RepID=A0A7J0FRK2_9ERIC|nr:pectin lyase-like superfamily protein [Actinidia rufa]